MKVTFLGTGTSHGIPVIGCQCAVCHSQDPKDKRHRCSIYIQSGEGSSRDTALLVDTGPEFRIQCLTYNIRRLDAAFLTHSHADHLHGIDDLRIFSFNLRESIRNLYKQRDPLPLNTNPHTKKDIEHRFGYIFTPVKEGGGKPNLKLVARQPYETFETGPFTIQSVPLLHGSLEASGWIFRETRYLEDQGEGFTAAKDRNVTYDDADEVISSPAIATRPRDAAAAARGIAYLTDCSCVPPETIAAAKGVEHLVIDGLRMKPHNTHFSYDQALECAAAIAPRHVWLIHLNHELTHVSIDEYLQKAKCRYPGLEQVEVHPAWDGLTLYL